MYFDYLHVLVFTAVGVLFVMINMVVGSLVRPKRTVDEGLETYECGEETIGDAWLSFDIRYYTVALVYVVFAVEIAFLFPWARVLKTALADPTVGIFALVEGVAFVLILFLGLIYVWAKGDLDWVLSYRGGEYQPRPRPEYRLPVIDELRVQAEGGDAEGESDENTDDEEAA